MTIAAIRSPDAPSVQGFDGSHLGLRRARPVLGRDRIDVNVADYQAPGSMYPIIEAHPSFYAAFGNRTFTRLEHALKNRLEDLHAVIDIDPALALRGLNYIYLRTVSTSFQSSRGSAASQRHAIRPGDRRPKGPVWGGSAPRTVWPQRVGRCRYVHH